MPNQNHFFFQREIIFLTLLLLRFFFSLNCRRSELRCNREILRCKRTAHVGNCHKDNGKRRRMYDTLDRTFLHFFIYIYLHTPANAVQQRDYHEFMLQFLLFFFLLACLPQIIFVAFFPVTLESLDSCTGACTRTLCVRVGFASILNQAILLSAL